MLRQKYFAIKNVDYGAYIHSDGIQPPSLFDKTMNNLNGGVYSRVKSIGGNVPFLFDVYALLLLRLRVSLNVLP